MARLKTVKSIFVNIFLFLDNGLFQPTAVQHLSVLLVPLFGNDSNLLIVFYVQIMPDDFVM
ncbi:hypothetical protein WJE47_04190, partial [Salmonella enterica subsp. enterica serovar Corvallis]